MADSGSKTFSISKFDGSNYKTWAADMKNVLIWNNLWDIVVEGGTEIVFPRAAQAAVQARAAQEATGNQPYRPAVQAQDAVEAIEDTNDTVGKNAKAKALMSLNFQSEFKYLSMTDDTARELWIALQNKYGKVTALGASNLHRKLLRYTFNEGEPLRTQIE